MPRAVMHTSFKVKRSTSSSITAETKSVLYLPNGKTGTPIEHALSTATVSYKGLRNWILARGRRYTVSAAPARSLFWSLYVGLIIFDRLVR